MNKDQRTEMMEWLKEQGVLLAGGPLYRLINNERVVYLDAYETLDLMQAWHEHKSEQEEQVQLLQHEMLDRTHIICSMIDDFLLDHPLGANGAKEPLEAAQRLLLAARETDNES
jgi:hypothetical protein